LTLNPDYNAACGFTLEEFETYFTQYLPDVLKYNQSEGFISATASLDALKNEIISYYDGYSWNRKTRLLNPFSLIKMLDDKELINYWFATGTPSFLMEYLKREGKIFDFPTNPIMHRDSLSSVDLKNIELTPLMFQTGYLTIDKKLNPSKFLLRLPNKEVSYALKKNILKFLLGQDDYSIITLLSEKIRKALEDFDSRVLTNCFRDILIWISHSALKASEGGGPQAIIYSVLKALRFKVTSEVTESEGMMDLLITTTRDTVFICEFKYEKLESKENETTEALEARRGTLLLKLNKAKE
jgi:hypothetical protein